MRHRLGRVKRELAAFAVMNHKQESIAKSVALEINQNRWLVSD
jgi:hypothetical protein